MPLEMLEICKSYTYHPMNPKMICNSLLLDTGSAYSVSTATSGVRE